MVGGPGNMASLRGVQTCLGMVAPSTGSSAFHFNVSGKYRIRQNYPTSVAKGSAGGRGGVETFVPGREVSAPTFRA